MPNFPRLRALALLGRLSAEYAYTLVTAGVVLLVTGRPVELLPLRWQSYYIAKRFHLRHLSDAIAAALADGAAGVGTSPLTRGRDITNN